MESSDLRRSRPARVRGCSTRDRTRTRVRRGAAISAAFLVAIVLGSSAPAFAQLGVIVTGGAVASGGSTSAVGHMIAYRTAPTQIPLPLSGATIGGTIFVTVEPVAGLDQVAFHLDDPSRLRRPMRVEVTAPFDFNGGTPTGPIGWSSAGLTNGLHVITAALHHLDGTESVLHAMFIVNNASPPGGISVGANGHTVRYRTQPSGPHSALHGQMIDGEIYVTVEPVTGVDVVTFWLDDPQRLGAPYRVEVNPPFDFAGATPAGPDPWDTQEIPDGQHEITVLVEYFGGTSEVIRAVFTTDNIVPSVRASQNEVEFEFTAGTVGYATASVGLWLTSGNNLPYTLSVSSAPWIAVTQNSGVLPATLSISVVSSGLAPGDHVATIIASCPGYAPAEITVTASVGSGPPPPPTGSLVLGTPLVQHTYGGGSPGTQVTNVPVTRAGGLGGTYTVSYPSAPWMTATPASGSIPGQIQVSTNSAGLAPGVFENDITISSPGLASATLMVRVIVTAGSGTGTTASSISRHGITWNFADEAEVGQFANGDWYVVGPVLLDSTNPSWTGTYDGAMINPVYDGDHGYDSRWDFDPALRVDTDGLLLLPGQSLICVDSWRNGESGAPSSNNTLGIPRPALKTAAVLTCVSFAPPEGTFRPPYGGTDKPLFHVSQLRTWLLPQLPRPAGTPSITSVAQSFERVWLDHTEKWTNRYTHPSDNMHDYGRDLASEYNTGSLMLMCDFTLAQKETLLIRLVQIGIDMHAIIESGAEWGPDTGGHGSGRKWPVLLAGILLDDPEMMDMGNDYGTSTAMEDCQTFYLTSSQTSDYPGEQVGNPVWGERHCSDPGSDPGATGYRTCCTANAWVGAVLSVHILTGETTIDVKSLWNHDALFDYQDLYMEEQSPGSWQRSWSGFQEDMWDMYRDDYPPVYDP